MIRPMGYLVTVVFFVVVYVTLVAPALEQVTDAVTAVDSTGLIAYDGVLTALFYGMPLLLLGGVFLVLFVVATGIRGTSR
jgi:hypothetical protein